MAQYIDIDSDIKYFSEMLKVSGNQFLVPVIVEDGKVKIGYGGSSETGKT